jgi:Ice-binding-like
VFYSSLPATLSGLSNLSTGGNGSTAFTYTPGVYKGASSLSMPTGITLDAQGNPDAIFVFVAGSTVNLASGQ